MRTGTERECTRGETKAESEREWDGQKWNTTKRNEAGGKALSDKVVNAEPNTQHWTFEPDTWFTNVVDASCHDEKNTVA